jgi:hypothetical protein
MVYGEFCGTSIQKGGRYTQGEAMIFRAFDIRLGDNLVHTICLSRFAR